MEQKTDVEVLDELADDCFAYAQSQGFHDDWKYGVPIHDSELLAILSQKLALIHSEVSEALEELRNPRFSHDIEPFMEEIVDVVIRSLDTAGLLEEHQRSTQSEKVVTFGEIFAKKRLANSLRPRMHNKNF